MRALSDRKPRSMMRALLLASETLIVRCAAPRSVEINFIETTDCRQGHRKDTVHCGVFAKMSRGHTFRHVSACGLAHRANSP